VASSPESADWCVFYQDATWMTLPDNDPFAEMASTWINGRCRDISKRHVEQVFDAVFGYPLAIDPLTYQGVCLRKSNRNYVKNVTLLECPLPLGELNEEYAYQRLVDSRVPGLGIVSLSTYVVGGQVASVFKAIHPDWISTGTFVDALLDISVVAPASVFSPQELALIAGFCHAMGLDYGKLDIQRDVHDQRLYILDANNSPGSDSRNPGPKRVRADQLAQAFLDRYPPRSMSLASPAAFGTPARSNDQPDGMTSLSQRVDAQAARIAQLEAEVETLGESLARIFVTFRGDRPRSGKKNRKKPGF
jgi:hypothetical protein